jgi:hypothetical protein
MNHDKEKVQIRVMVHIPLPVSAFSQFVVGLERTRIICIRFHCSNDSAQVKKYEKVNFSGGI